MSTYIYYFLIIKKNIQTTKYFFNNKPLSLIYL